MDLFLTSAITELNPFITTEEVIQWMQDQNKRIHVGIEKIPFDQLDLWGFQNGVLKHSTGRFFSIEGIKVTTNWGRINNWTQPIINQPEIGYLGFITKEWNGILYFLMQAKIEPGNVNHVQLSPTLQATKSNYTRVHQGKSPAYLDYFLNARPHQILLDQLQSEQGARFLKKRNRNIIIKVDGEIEVLDNFIWLTLGQIKKLMSINNIINMDTRTVVSGIPFDDIRTKVDNGFNTKISNNIFLNSYFDRELFVHSFSEIVSFITNQKCKYELSVDKISLMELNDWKITSDSIHHCEGKYFKVIATKVTIENREVVSWTQPMIEPAQAGLCAFVGKLINGVLHFAVQSKLECGNFDIIELAPTVQCLTGNYENEKSYDTLPFLSYVLNVPKSKIIFDTFQSEEGGRFFKEQNRNLIVLAGNEISLDLPDNYIWMTLNQLQSLIQFNNYINIQARSLLAAISFT